MEIIDFLAFVRNAWIYRGVWGFAVKVGLKIVAQSSGMCNVVGVHNKVRFGPVSKKSSHTAHIPLKLFPYPV